MYNNVFQKLIKIKKGQNKKQFNRRCIERLKVDFIKRRNFSDNRTKPFPFWKFLTVI